MIMHDHERESQAQGAHSGWVGKCSKKETSGNEEVNDKRKPSGTLMLLHLNSPSQEWTHD